MLHILEFLTGFYWILLPQFVVENLLHGGKGLPGALGFNTAVFYTDIGGDWSGYRINKLLKEYDIPMWGWGYAFEQFYFRVPLEDAPHAQRVMLAAGIDLLN